MLGKPLRDRRHLLLEITRDREVQNTRSACTAVLKIMRHSAWDQDEGALGSIEPALTNANAHRAFNHIESVVFRVGVRPGTLGVGLQPPLGDGVPSLCFVAVGFGSCTSRLRIIPDAPKPSKMLPYRDL